ncbi:phosphoribosylaminoimidazole carboxylase ATPase subunit [Cutibacterium acnes JCM 18909]|nr:phosphoribosylaminoimidazole carboxylase ATPase subunit [Cutibacterium acnes JCM 18909]
MNVVTSYTIGIIGGGQLARMMHQAAIGLGCAPACWPLILTILRPR